MVLAIVAFFIATIFVIVVVHPRPVVTLAGGPWEAYSSIHDMANHSNLIVIGTASTTTTILMFAKSLPPATDVGVYPQLAYNITISAVVKGNWTRSYVWVLTTGGEVEYNGTVYRYTESFSLPMQRSLILFVLCYKPSEGLSFSVDLNVAFGFGFPCGVLSPAAYYYVDGASVYSQQNQPPWLKFFDGVPVDGMSLSDFLTKLKP